MSDSTEKTKDIDSYGVWVKRPPQDAAADELNTDSDFPDFSGLDSFGNTETPLPEDPVVADDFNFDSLDDNEDTALSADELANISDDFAMEEVNSEPAIETESTDNSVESNPFEDNDILQNQPADSISDEPVKEEDFSFDIPESGAAEENAAAAESFPEEAFTSEQPAEENIPDSGETPAADNTEFDSMFADIPFDEPKTEESTEGTAEDSSAETPASSSGFDPSAMEDGEISLDDFLDGGFTDPNPGAENQEAAPVPGAEESPVSNQEDGEISLDDFLDGGFTDPNPGAEAPSASTGVTASSGISSDEISLDDFLDEDFESKPKEDDVSNDAPLDINVDFNEEAEAAPTEEFTESEVTETEQPAEEMFNSGDTAVTEPASSNAETGETEEISLDDFGVTENSDDATAVAAGAAVNAAANNGEEEIDLSDFGIDSNADETPVEQDVQSAKKGKVVDYDIAIDNEDQGSSGPTVNEINVIESSGASAGAENTAAPSAEPVQNENSTSVSNRLLEQIIADLSGLKNEINSLKGDLEDLKTREAAAPVSAASGITEPAFEMPAQDSTADNSVNEPENQSSFVPEPETEQTGTGFFNNEDEDETIALSGDELNNIMNTADFSEVDEPVQEEPAEENIIAEEPAANIDESEPTPKAETIEADFSNDTPFEAIENDSVVIPDEEHDSGLSMDIQDENLEEPDLNNLDNSDPEAADEIAIPGVNELANGEDNLSGILVESSNEDLMNSVKDSAEDIPQVMEQEAEPAEVFEEPVMENAEADNEAPSEDVFDPMAEIMKAEPTVEEQISDENMDYLSEEKPSLDVEEDSEVPTVSGIIAEREAENENNAESAAENTAAAEQENQAETNFPDDLKSDVKSVLLYMDQLLENLPEDKIVEFAKSEQFATYKKLFSELGLS